MLLVLLFKQWMRVQGTYGSNIRWLENYFSLSYLIGSWKEAFGKNI